MGKEEKIDRSPPTCDNFAIIIIVTIEFIVGSAPVVFNFAVVVSRLGFEKL